MPRKIIPAKKRTTKKTSGTHEVLPLPGFHEGAHVWLARVYYEDTDAGGVVYYANYLRFAERARTEALRALHIDQQQAWVKEGYAFAVRRCEVDFIAPARLDDYLTITTHLKDIGSASLHMHQVIARAERTLVTVTTRIACVSREFRAMRIPPKVMQALNTAFELRTED